MCNFPEITLYPPKGRKKNQCCRNTPKKKFYSKTLKNKQKLLKRGEKIVAFDRDV